MEIHPCHVETVSILLEHGADPNLQSNNGWSALMTAIVAGRVTIALNLIDSRADVSIVNNSGDSALTVATEQNLPPVVQKIIGEIASADLTVLKRFRALVTNDCKCLWAFQDSRDATSEGS